MSAAVCCECNCMALFCYRLWKVFAWMNSVISDFPVWNLNRAYVYAFSPHGHRGFVKLRSAAMGNYHVAAVQIRFLFSKYIYVPCRNTYVRETYRKEYIYNIWMIPSRNIVYFYCVVVVPLTVAKHTYTKASNWSRRRKTFNNATITETCWNK